MSHPSFQDYFMSVGSSHPRRSEGLRAPTTLMQHICEEEGRGVVLEPYYKVSETLGSLWERLQESFGPNNPNIQEGGPSRVSRLESQVSTLLAEVSSLRQEVAALSSLKGELGHLRAVLESQGNFEPPLDESVPEPDAAAKWLEAHPEAVEAHRGKQIAIHPKLGIIASGEDFASVYESVEKQGRMAEVTFDAIPA